MDTMLTDGDEFLTEVQAWLAQAQEYTRQHYNAHHRDLEFKGDWVWLQLLNHPTHSGA
jgi:hypothetical protein